MNRAGIIALVGVLIALMTSQPLILNVPAYGQEGITSIPREQIPSAIEAELEDDANDIPGTAILLIYSDTEWTGTVMDSGLLSSPHTGAGDDKIQFTCEGQFAQFNTSFQKQTEEGYLDIAVIQEESLIGTASTDEPLGAALISDRCVTAEEEAPEIRDSACLIATAAFGSELAPQVQFLRDFRDNHILSTAAGQSFMSVFNTVYYSFSPQVAEYEREQPWLQQTVRVAIYPLLGILTMSEKAYFASEGEYGAIAAGLAASSMIGAVYLTPLAFSIKQVRERKPGYKILALVVAGVSAALVLSVLAESTMAMMITTSALVLSISAISALVLAGAISRLLKKERPGN